MMSEIERVLARLEDGDFEVFEEYDVQWGDPVGDPIHTVPYRIDLRDGSWIESKVTIS
jgi:hypothetical protein